MKQKDFLSTNFFQMQKGFIKMVEIVVGGEQDRFSDSGGCGNPKVIFAHVAGCKPKRPARQAVLAESVNLSIPFDDDIMVDVEQHEFRQEALQFLKLGLPPFSLDGEGLDFASRDYRDAGEVPFPERRKLMVNGKGQAGTPNVMHQNIGVEKIFHRVSVASISSTGS